jgi:hypothetical protein
MPWTFGRVIRQKIWPPSASRRTPVRTQLAAPGDLAADRINDSLHVDDDPPGIADTCDGKPHVTHMRSIGIVASGPRVQPEEQAMAARKSRSKTTAARRTTVADYLASLTPERRAVIEEARAFVRRHIRKGYAEFMNWGVINWGIPLEEFSDTHNGQPLCYVGLGAKKSYNSLYLMGAYDSSNGTYTTPFTQKLLVDAFKKAGKRLDMGKCCLHFKKLGDLELTSVAKVIGMSTPKEYVAYYKRVKGLG